MSGGLTAKQAECLEFIRAYIEDEGGVSPSLSEIALHLGIGSKSGVLRLLTGLNERGRLTWSRQRPRSIVLLDDMTPYEPDALRALPTATLEALQADVRRILHDRTVEAILAHHRAPAMDARP